jgi:hypothetical protein
LKYALLTILGMALLTVVQPVSGQLHIPPDPQSPHGNLCPRSLKSVNDVSLESIGLYNVGTALRLENGVVLTPQSTDQNGEASYLLYMAYGSTIQVQPVSIGGTGGCSTPSRWATPSLCPVM